MKENVQVQIPRENPGGHRENAQTPHRKACSPQEIRTTALNTFTHLFTAVVTKGVFLNQRVLDVVE